METLLPGTAGALAALLQSRFGAGVGVSVACIAGNFPLFPEEELHVARAVESRRNEFSTGRWCARKALEMAGSLRCAIPVGPQLGPQWPAGFTGSITHSAGLAAAVAAPEHLYKAIGIDLCTISTTAIVLSETSQFVSNQAEVAEARAVNPHIDPRVLLFSAKEAAIKAISASMGRFVDFTEINVSLRHDRFTISLPGLNGDVHGWWDTVDGRLLTGASRT